MPVGIGQAVSVLEPIARDKDGLRIPRIGRRLAPSGLEKAIGRLTAKEGVRGKRADLPKVAG